MFCSNCGKPVENSRFCPNCGAEIIMPQAPEPVPAPAPAPVQPAPVPAAAPVQPALAKKKSHKGLFITLGTVGGVIIVGAAAVITFLALNGNALAKKYELGREEFDDSDYESALEIFTDLKDYKDSRYWAEYSQLEIDSKDLNDLIDNRDFDGAIKILEERKEFFDGENEDEAKEAGSMITELQTIKSAYADMDNKAYSDAYQKFDSLTLSREDYIEEADYCKLMANAIEAKENKEWGKILANLYGIMIDDPELNFLVAPSSAGGDNVIADAYSGINVDEPAIRNTITTSDNVQAELLETALMGFRYDKAIQAENDKKYDEAIKLFTDLGSFLDSKDHLSNCTQLKEELEGREAIYQSAETYYNNGEYYKAQKAYKLIPGYKDADTKAAKCEQSLPKNGSMKKSSGKGCTIKITAPSSTSVFIKFYNSKEKAVAQVFIRAGKTVKLNLKAQTYTIKVAYGNTWYGKIDLFGESGSYSQLKNGSSMKFKLKRRYIYTLRLWASTTGNVGSASVPGGASGM